MLEGVFSMFTGLNPVGTTEFRKEKSAPETKTVLKAEQEQTKDQTAVYDVFELEKKEDNTVCHDGIIYTSSANFVDHLKAEQAENMARFLQTVKDTIFKQSAQISGDGIWKVIARGDYEVDSETQKAAQEAISEDGYWGVEQTSKRIVAFAKALVGGDASRIGEMKDAFIKGYEAARTAWGGELPAIAGQTYNAVMKLFDEWANEGKE